LSEARRYRHYKGGIYELVCEAVMEADHTPVMVYRGQDGAVWVRPRAMFFETVSVDGAPVPRFSAIPASCAAPTVPRTE
jgi:hypothetical protein